MSTNGAGSAGAEGPRKRWLIFRWVAVLIVIGLYLATLTRLAISKNWGDLTAAHMLGLTCMVAALLGLVSIGLGTVAAAGSRRRLSRGRAVAALFVVGLIVAGFATSIIRTGTIWEDPVGQLITQTAGVASMLLVLTAENARARA
ncbi:hypothetical protein [Nocardia colli]|uniref:hypothetical protein n=1 Tax=Nocardia colli TaxID=2545717 RepID=UPI0035DD5DEF